MNDFNFFVALLFLWATGAAEILRDTEKMKGIRVN